MEESGRPKGLEGIAQREHPESEYSSKLEEQEFDECEDSEEDCRCTNKTNLLISYLYRHSNGAHHQQNNTASAQILDDSSLGKRELSTEKGDSLEDNKGITEAQYSQAVTELEIMKDRYSKLYSRLEQLNLVKKRLRAMAELHLAINIELKEKLDRELHQLMARSRSSSRANIHPPHSIPALSLSSKLTDLKASLGTASGPHAASSKTPNSRKNILLNLRHF